MIELVEDVLELEPQQAQQHPAPTIQQGGALTQATPNVLLQMAISQGADLDRLERLMALQVQWEEREAVKAYNAAFSAFKAEAVKIIKNRNVTAGPLAGKKYAELFAVVNAITPALSAHGLSAAWKTTKDEKDWIEVTCTLKHVDGHAESVSMGGPPDAGGAKNKIQERASTITYLQRYTLKAITGLSEQDDDSDGFGPRTHDEIPKDLKQKAQEAAMLGWAELSKFIKECAPADRKLLEPMSAALKACAKTADKKGWS
jgi:hypothetical protein